MDTQTSVEKLLAKEEIRSALYKWASSLGRHEWESVRSVFHDGALDARGMFDGDIDGFVAWQRKHHAGIDQSFYSIGAVLIEFATPDTALAETHVTAFHRYGRDARQARLGLFGEAAADEEKPMQSIIAGRFIDRFECRGGVWKIAERVTVYEWLKREDAPWNPPFQSGWHVGCPNRTDPLFAMRGKMGLAL